MTSISSESKPRSSFSAKEARRLIPDLFEPEPRIYWIDLLATISIAYGFALLYFGLTWTSPFKLPALLISGFALFRAGTFIHELQHFPPGKMTSFKVFWDLACGIAMMMPSFFYDNHADHHSRKTYGTDHDGEYIPLGAGPLAHFVVYVGQALILPLLVAVRFTVVTPISFLHPKLRREVLERYSFYGINPFYRRRLPNSGPKRWWTALEIACSVRAWAILALPAMGLMPWHRVVDLYILAIVSLGLNYVRNIVAHRYRNDGPAMTYEEQLLDSINLEGIPIATELFFPLGLRFHALHHVFPTVPYHNLAAAHHRLMQGLPADSPYRRTVFPGYFAALRQLWRDARASRHQHQHVVPAPIFAYRQSDTSTNA